MMLVAHITDTHITSPGTRFYGIVDTAGALARAIAAINRLDPSPDLVVLTGDLVESGKPEEYAHLHSLLAPLRMPLLAIPGNHDARDPTARSLRRRRVSAPARVFELCDRRLSDAYHRIGHVDTG